MNDILQPLRSTFLTLAVYLLLQNMASLLLAWGVTEMFWDDPYRNRPLDRGPYSYEEMFWDQFPDWYQATLEGTWHLPVIWLVAWISWEVLQKRFLKK